MPTSEEEQLAADTVNVDIEKIILQESGWLADELSQNKVLNPSGKEVRPSAALRHALAVDAFIAKQVKEKKTILVRNRFGKTVELDWKNMASLFD